MFKQLLSHRLGLSQYNQFHSGTGWKSFCFSYNKYKPDRSLPVWFKKRRRGSVETGGVIQGQLPRLRWFTSLSNSLSSFPLCVSFPLIPPSFLPLCLNSPVFSEATARCLPVLPDSSQRDDTAGSWQRGGKHRDVSLWPFFNVPWTPLTLL